MKRTTGIREVAVRTVLTPTGGFIDGFTHSLNPYMGCTFGEGGCGAYCYVAESPIGLYAGIPWGTWVEVKRNAHEALRRELARTPDPRQVRVFMSSATDPYQPQERHAGVTRRVLQVFHEQPVGLLVVQTRSPLVERDVDLLASMPFAWLSMTIETDDDEVRRSLTPTCPSIERRFEALRAARAAGVHVQVTVSPALPHHRDRFIDRLAEVADRVIVDTLCGDGASGRRSARRPIVAKLSALGIEDWRDELSARALYEGVKDRLGEGRVGWSQDGFNALAREARDVTASCSGLLDVR
jgi:DNA repair photolyase